MARNNHIEGGNTLRVGLDDTTEKGCVDVASNRGISITARDDARVDTSSIAAPQVDVNVGDWIAGVGVDDLNIESQRNTVLGFSDVATDIFALDVVGSLFTFGRKDTGSAVFEQVVLGNIEVDAAVVRSVRGVQDTVGGPLDCFVSVGMEKDLEC